MDAGSKNKEGASERRTNMIRETREERIQRTYREINRAQEYMNKTNKIIRDMVEDQRTEKVEEILNRQIDMLEAVIEENIVARLMRLSVDRANALYQLNEAWYRGKAEGRSEEEMDEDQHLKFLSQTAEDITDTQEHIIRRYLLAGDEDIEDIERAIAYFDGLEEETLQEILKVIYEDKETRWIANEEHTMRWKYMKAVEIITGE